MVYFIATEDMRFVKIGYTGKITRDRFNYCNSHCPLDLKLLLFIHGDESLEKSLHLRFSLFRKKYEWFHLSEEILSFIDQNKINHVPYKQNRAANNDLINSIKKDYLGNVSLSEIAIKYQRTKRSIQGILRRNRIKKRLLLPKAQTL